MFDKDTMIITYDAERGEPRGSRSRKADPAALGLGSCIDCGLCVEVCPTGIDIRNGLQYECIGCAGCIDACDQVMDKMGYARGLVRYTTTHALANHWDFRQIVRHAFRPRVLIYVTILLSVTAALFTHLALRVPLKVDVLRDRGTLAREVEDGRIENVYRLQIMNTAEQPRVFRIGVTGLPSAAIASEPQVSVDPAGNRLVSVRVRAEPGSGHPGSNRIDFQVEAADDSRVVVQEKSVFYLPR
ncbi:MAG TPA: FixG Ig-like domain-containing protein, partial [Burkholderiaceae bacterium]|nr:FixG Ig-like domain-containing protein [Burkholderiaceae bacterium]